VVERLGYEPLRYPARERDLVFHFLQPSMIIKDGLLIRGEVQHRLRKGSRKHTVGGIGMRSDASKRFNESSQTVHKPASPQTVGSPRQCVEEDASPRQVSSLQRRKSLPQPGTVADFAGNDF
jgi:hypothetical protein